MTHHRFLLLGALMACSNSRKANVDTVKVPAPKSAGAPIVAPAVAARPFPLVGIAVISDSLKWCAEFPQDSTSPRPAVGARVAIVFVALEEVPAFPAKIAAVRDRACSTPFGQGRWFDYSAYDLEPVDSLGYPDSEETPMATLAVVSAAEWTRGADELVRADLDGDGLLEEARRCYADEGEHFSIWTRMRDGTYRRRAHEYYDHGAFVEVTCTGIEASELDSTPQR